MDAKEQIGSWKRNNFPYPDDEVKGEVLTLTIKHVSGAVSSYGYIITAESAPVPEIKVVRNDSVAQAIILPDGSVMAAAVDACDLCVDGRTVKLDEGTYIE
jgi:hypothetical protein